VQQGQVFAVEQVVMHQIHRAAVEKALQIADPTRNAAARSNVSPRMSAKAVSARLFSAIARTRRRIGARSRRAFRRAAKRRRRAISDCRGHRLCRYRDASVPA
jgi:hypothetical protein